ncbi:uncharacterized protein LOC132631100 [Lycium barbarum]|uniref:uncharacterized protein LOC132631100 n=1 Tax=Lycium barbarum TaxID=112863 RepID=UPI00293F2D66|nr:uncharacterized protein LOC132631100 [Lycium barbarum]
MNTENSQIPTRNGTAVGPTLISHVPFHPDDYTHPCHPLYVHPSDLLASSLVSELFDGTCYGSWRRSILIALSRCNDLVVAWLANSVTKEIHRSVVYSEFAKDIWRELEARYGKVDGARVFELKKALAHISQGSLDIASYFTKTKQLWDELASISVLSENRCNCIGGAKSEEEQKVYQFLMGLNEVYVQVRSNILMIKPLPSMDTTYSILLSDEKQRQVSASTVFPSESASFHASFNTGGSKFAPKVQFDPQKASLYCKYCKRTGYVIEKCHRLHGYPSNFKFTRGSGSNSGPRKVAAKAASVRL